MKFNLPAVIAISFSLVFLSLTSIAQAQECDAATKKAANANDWYKNYINGTNDFTDAFDPKKHNTPEQTETYLLKAKTEFEYTRCQSLAPEKEPGHNILFVSQRRDNYFPTLYLAYTDLKLAEGSRDPEAKAKYEAAAKISFNSYIEKMNDPGKEKNLAKFEKQRDSTQAALSKEKNYKSIFDQLCTFTKSDNKYCPPAAAAPTTDTDGGSN